VLSDCRDHVRTQITALAIRIGWERSRLSHHLRRLERRQLVELRTAPTDRRATEITLTDQGWAEITQASTGHVELIQRLFFDGLPNELIEPMTVALESIYDNVIERGTLPRPAHEFPNAEIAGGATRSFPVRDGHAAIKGDDERRGN